MSMAMSMRSSAAWNSARKGSSASSSRTMRRRSSAFCALAMSGFRAANHSTCCIFMRSHGGLPTTASKPPRCPPSSANSASCQSRQTPGNATCQCRKCSSLANSRAFFNRLRNSSARGASPTGTVPVAMATGSPNTPSSQAPTKASFLPVGCSQSKACSMVRNPSSGSVSRSTSANKAKDALASASSASANASKRCMGSAAAKARCKGSWTNRPPWPSALSKAARTQQPNRLSPQRRW